MEVKIYYVRLRLVQGISGVETRQQKFITKKANCYLSKTSCRTSDVHLSLVQQS